MVMRRELKEKDVRTMQKITTLLSNMDGSWMDVLNPYLYTSGEVWRKN